MDGFAGSEIERIAKEVKGIICGNGMTIGETAMKAGLMNHTVSRVVSGKQGYNIESLIDVLDALGYRIRIEKEE